jgi:hypothetical protein
MINQASSKDNLTIWDLISRSQGWKEFDSQKFDMARQHLAGLFRSIYAGGEPLSATHRAIAQVLETFKQGGMVDFTLEEYVPESAPPGTISQILWEDGTNGLFVALPWDPASPPLTAEALAMDFAIGAKLLTRQPAEELVTIAWVSDNPDITIDGRASNYALRTYSRDQLKKHWRNYSDRIEKTIAALPPIAPPPPAQHNEPNVDSTPPVFRSTGNGGQVPGSPPPAQHNKPKADSTPPVFRSSENGGQVPIVPRSPDTVSAVSPSVTPDFPVDFSSAILTELRSIRSSIESLVQAQAAAAPPKTFTYPIDRFKGFDFGALGIEVIERDSQGEAARLAYQGDLYTRRSPENKFAPVIYFSKAVGKNDEGVNLYQRLIEFKTFSDVEQISPKAARLAGVGG